MTSTCLPIATERNKVEVRVLGLGEVASHCAFLSYSTLAGVDDEQCDEEEYSGRDVGGPASDGT